MNETDEVCKIYPGTNNTLVNEYFDLVVFTRIVGTS